MISETRIALKNIGRIDPMKIDDSLACGGYRAMQRAIHMPAERIIADLIRSGLRGRGGAGFSTGMKKKFTSQSSCRLEECMRYLVCNADEGEPGTFKDRVIMEQDPHLLIEGMVIAAYAVGASTGYLYIRGEYRKAIETMQVAIAAAHQAGMLGANICQSGFDFKIELKLGAGSYLCGEELTLLESLEGKRGYPRIKPPYPAEKGLFGMPTLVNNVETLAHIPTIIERGADWYRRLGTAESPGTKIFTVSGDVARPGVYEAEMGITLRALCDDLAGGMRNDKPFKAALLGGAAGTFVPAAMLDVPLAFETLSKRDATLGSGAVIVLDDTRKVSPMLDSILRFFAHESCGKCVPCRIGCHQLCRLLDQIRKEKGALQSSLQASLLAQAQLMAATSLCPLGQSPLLPIASALRHFNDDFGESDAKRDTVHD